MEVQCGRKAKVADEGSGDLSDESDFYGDHDTKQELEARAAGFDVREWLQNKQPTLVEIADAKIAAAEVVADVKLYNPYEGHLSGRQLGETVEEFIKRLPPASTPDSQHVQWIWIANPYWKSPTIDTQASSQGRIETEGPPGEKTEWARFIPLGGRLLEELTTAARDIEKEKAGQTKASVTRAVNIKRDMIIKKILDKAVDLHCTSGKWMIFCTHAEVNDVWAVVAQNTATNELGIAAKVAPDDGGDNRKSRLICIYTKDFTNMKDVYRVVNKLKALGLLSGRDKAIYYKCDAYTYLGLDSGNPWNIRASLYNSKDVLQNGPEQKEGKKLDGYFYKKKKDEGNWRSLD